MTRPRSSRVRTGAIQVDGLAELNRALKEMGDLEGRREIRNAGKRAATTIAALSRSAAGALGGVAAKVAPSIKASAGTQSAGVSLGGNAYPMAAGAEFGAYQYPQFKPWRGNKADAGYFVYPTIREHAEEIAGPYLEALDSVIRKAGLS